MDQCIEYQQNPGEYDLAVVTISAPTNESETLLPLVPVIVDAVREAENGQIVSVVA
ncbi:hypothetical protein [Longibacter salinarum]|nr:hypothetical protein [Longibacter salinarum]